MKVAQSLAKCQPRTFADFFGSGKPGICYRPFTQVLGELHGWQPNFVQRTKKKNNKSLSHTKPQTSFLFWVVTKNKNTGFSWALGGRFELRPGKLLGHSIGVHVTSELFGMSMLTSVANLNLGVNDPCNFYQLGSNSKKMLSELLLQNGPLLVGNGVIYNRYKRPYQIGTWGCKPH